MTPCWNGDDSDVDKLDVVRVAGVDGVPAVNLSGVGIRDNTDVGGTVWSCSCCPKHDGRKILSQEVKFRHDA